MSRRKTGQNAKNNEKIVKELNEYNDSDLEGTESEESKTIQQSHKSHKSQKSHTSQYDKIIETGEYKEWVKSYVTYDEQIKDLISQQKDSTNRIKLLKKEKNTLECKLLDLLIDQNLDNIDMGSSGTLKLNKTLKPMPITDNVISESIKEILIINKIADKNKIDKILVDILNLINEKRGYKENTKITRQIEKNKSSTIRSKIIHKN